MEYCFYQVRFRHGIRAPGWSPLSRDISLSALSSLAKKKKRQFVVWKRLQRFKVSGDSEKGEAEEEGCCSWSGSGGRVFLIEESRGSWKEAALATT